MTTEGVRKSVGMYEGLSTSSKMSTSTTTGISSSPWLATEKMLHAEVIRSFLPQNNPQLAEFMPKKLIKSLQNLYPGDQIYIFETLDTGKGLIWARGYSVIQPLPADFISASVNVKKLPEAHVSISIFPLAYVKVVNELEIKENKIDGEVDRSFDNGIFYNNTTTTSYDDYDDISSINDDSDLDLLKIKRPQRPPLPMTESEILNNLANEIKLTLKTISTTLFAVYAKNNFDFFEKLTKIYYELDDIRTSLHYDLYTEVEKSIAKKKVISLMSKFSKLLSSGGGMINRSYHSKSDIDGKASIIARDEKTAEMYQFPSNKENDLVDPAEIAQSQITSALSPNSIGAVDTSFVPPKNSKFEETIPSNIMVDFKEVVGSSSVIPKGYAGMKAYMFLRNAKKRLTEAFCINIGANQELQLENLASALFTNIPSIDVESSRIYLVALLTETINIADENSTLPVIRKGICAGVADVSRIFSHRKGHLVSGKSHRFVIKLFSSFLDSQKQEVKLFAGMNQMMAKSLTMINNGWGELVDRIISGSSKGVAVNPRAESLILSIKELKLSTENKKVLNNISGSNGDFNNVAWACIPTLSFNPLEKDENRVYMKLNKINDKGLKLNEKSFLTVHVRSQGDTLMFAKGKNETLLNSWKFLSVSPNESIEELIAVRGFSETPDNATDYLLFDLFADNQYVGGGKYLLRSGNEIHDTGIATRTPATVDILSQGSTVCATLEMNLEAVGKAYNRDPTGTSILNWKNNYGNNLVANEAQFIEMLSKLKRIKLSTLVRFFSNFCLELFSAYDAAVKSDLKKLQQALFDALVHLLDATIARYAEYVSLYDSMLKEFSSYFPKIGESLLGSMALVFGSFTKDWNANGRALCRVSYLVLKMCCSCVKDQQEFKNQVYLFTNTINNFLDSNVENVLPDQLLIVETLELYLDLLHDFFTAGELTKFVVEWISVNKLKGLGSLEDSNATALTNKKRNREHRFVINKLFFVNRVLNNPIFSKNNASDTNTMFIAALDLVMGIFSSDITDLECSRLALGICLSIHNLSFGKDRVFTDTTKNLYIVMINFLPFLAQTFNKFYSYCANTGLFKKKRTFTQLFPSEYPFVENTMDSIVTDVTLVEILVDFTVIIIRISKVFEVYSDVFYQPTDVIDLGIYETLVTKYKIPTFQSNTSVTSMLQMVRYIIDAKYYPSTSWLSLHSISLQSAYLLLKLLETFIPKPSPNTLPMWNTYLILLCRVATAKPVSIEHLEYTPRKGCLQLTTDLRTKVSAVINDSWSLLGEVASKEDQARFQLTNFGGFQNTVMSMNNFSFLKPLILFTMQRNETCLNTGVKIFWTVVAAELNENDTLFGFERESISALYDLFENNHIYSPQSVEIQNYVAAFQRVTTKMDSEDEAYVEVVKLVKTLSRYLASLAELKAVPAGEEFDDDRTFHKLNISSYLMNVDRPELFQSFICDMYENYLDKKNYVQAALSLDLLANSWEWDIDTYLPECAKPKLPSQTAFKRKADLFKIVAANFVKANKLEQAVDVYTEMLDAYSKHNFDLLGLSFCHKELGKLYGELEHVDRLESTFFKIAFIGLGFPESIRGKEFVYEGLPYEHISSVHTRLNRLYPGSRIISNEEEAHKLLTEKPLGRFLFIKTVNPKKESYGGKMSHMAKQYVDNRNLNTFINTRRLPGASSITNLWTEEITYTTYMTFPTLMNRSEIKTTSIVKIPPIKNAIRSLILKNEELSNLEFLINQNLKDNIKLEMIASSSMFNSVSRILAGTVDSPVNGGAGQFRVFFTDDASIDIGESREEYDADCAKLKECFNDLTKIMNSLLKLHGLIVPDTLRLQHDSLVELFSKNFQKEIDDLKLDVKSELDYDALMKSLTSKNVHSKNRSSQTHTPTISANNSINNFSQINMSTTMTTSSSGKQRPNSVHSHHGSRHASHHGSTHRYGALLMGASRQSLREDDISMTHASYSTNHTGVESSMGKSMKKTLLNYK